MNPDPNHDRLREASWRRPLTRSEQTELEAWLAAHPEVRPEWETEAQLTSLLNRLPDAPVSSNFTARVLQAVRREAGEDARPFAARWGEWWRVFVPRLAMVVAVAGLAVFAVVRHQSNQRAAVADSVALAVEAGALSNPQVLEDFEAIRRLGQQPAWDEELLALMQ